MTDLQKLGGVAALIEAAVYMMGFGLYMTVLDSSAYVEPVEKVAFLADNQAIMHIGNLFIYVVFGAFLVPLALAVYERLKASSPAILQIATAFGLIWAGLVIASGMVFNIGMRTVVDLYGKDPAQARPSGWRLARCKMVWAVGTRLSAAYGFCC